MATHIDGSSLNTTKLFIPPVPEDYVPRARVHRLLERIPHRPLTLVSAPAGYGKSTTVAAWLRTCPLHKGWLALDEKDNDPAVFMIYFLAAVRRAVPAFTIGLGMEIEAGRMVSVPEFVRTLFDELDRLGEGVVLVIEDCHLIRLRQVMDIFHELMRHPHPLLHLVLLSRHDLSLPLSDWRARNWMVEVRGADLRFSLEETRHFLGEALGDSIDEDLVALLHKHTEGWAAGLRLALLSLVEGENMDDQVLELSIHNHHIVEYLAEQVLDGQPVDRLRFLLETSIVDRMCASLCEAIMIARDSGVDGQTLLVELTRNNLFTIPLDGEMRWFRYHHLLSEFLRRRLAQRYSREEIAGFHLRAARWFAAAGQLEEAIRHALVAGAMEEAIGFLAARRHELLNLEQWHRLISLFNLFPSSAVEKSPDLLLIKAWIAHVSRFDIDEINLVTSQVEAMLRDTDIDPERARLLRAENDIFRGICHYYRLEAADCCEHCQESLAVLPDSYYTLRSYGSIYTVGAYHLLGDLPGAFEIIRRARREDLAFPDYPRARNSAAEAYLCWMLGELQTVEKLGRMILSTASTGTQFNSLSWGHYFLASAHYHWNNLAEAEYHAQQVFDNRFVNHANANVFSGFILALVHQANGNEEMAKDALAQTAAFATEVRSQALVLLAQAMQAELDVRQGRTHAAVNWAKRILPSIRPVAMPLFYAAPLTVPKALLAGGETDAALLRDVLGRLRANVESTNNTRFLIEVLAIEALFHDSQSNERAAFSTLEHSLTLAMPSGFIRVYVDLGPRMRELLGRMPQKRDLAAYVARILDAFPRTKSTVGTGGLVEPLTERELEILNLLAQRLSNKEIAAELVISPMTVKRHTINIYQKLCVQSRRQAVEAANRLGILN